MGIHLVRLVEKSQILQSYNIFSLGGDVQNFHHIKL